MQAEGEGLSLGVGLGRGRWSRGVGRARWGEVLIPKRAKARLSRYFWDWGEEVCS